MDSYSNLDELLVASGNKNLPIEERHEAFAQLCKATKRFVWARVSEQIKDFHQIEDLVQDVYERLWSKAHQFTAQKKLFPYLRVVIRNILINHGKRHGRRWNMRNLESIPDWSNRLNEKGKLIDGDETW